MNFPLIVQNLKAGTPVKVMFENIRQMGVEQWLLNELAPSSYLTIQRKLTWVQLQTESFGWSKHIAIGMVLTSIFPIHPIHIALGAALYEVYALFTVDAVYMNPVNAILDIFFYFLGSYFVWVYILKQKTLLQSLREWQSDFALRVIQIIKPTTAK